MESDMPPACQLCGRRFRKGTKASAHLDARYQFLPVCHWCLSSCYPTTGAQREWVCAGDFVHVFFKKNCLELRPTLFQLRACRGVHTQGFSQLPPPAQRSLTGTYPILSMGFWLPAPTPCCWLLVCHRQPWQKWSSLKAIGKSEEFTERRLCAFHVCLSVCKQLKWPARQSTSQEKLSGFTIWDHQNQSLHEVWNPGREDQREGKKGSSLIDTAVGWMLVLFGLRESGTWTGHLRLLKQAYLLALYN